MPDESDARTEDHGHRDERGGARIDFGDGTLNPEEFEALIGLKSRFARLLVYMQLSWRPIFAFQSIFEFLLLDLIIGYSFLSGREGILMSLLNFSSFFVWYFGAKLAVLGVYSHGRTLEKIATVVGDEAASILPTAK